MKRIASLLLALALSLVLVQAALAATIITNGGTDSKDVEVKLVLKNGVTVDGSGDIDDPGTDADITDPDDLIYVYSIVVAWDDLKFDYIASDWDPNNLKYEIGVWQKPSADIAVENKSNAPVGISFKWDKQAANEKVNTIKGATFTLKDSSFNLADRSKTDVVAEYKKTNTVTVSGKGDQWSENYDKFDTIVVKADSLVAAP